MGLFDQFRHIFSRSDSASPQGVERVSSYIYGSERREQYRINPREGTRILVVDDSQTVITVLKRFLLSASCVVLEASDAKAGLNLALTQNPELIFLDIVMPGINGFAALRALRKNPRTKDLPVIMMSGNEQATAQFFGANIGADDFMKKPFSRSEVFERIERLLDENRVPRRFPQLEQPAEQHLSAAAENQQQINADHVAQTSHIDLPGYSNTIVPTRPHAQLLPQDVLQPHALTELPNAAPAFQYQDIYRPQTGGVHPPPAQTSPGMTQQHHAIPAYARNGAGGAQGNMDVGIPIQPAPTPPPSSFAAFQQQPDHAPAHAPMPPMQPVAHEIQQAVVPEPFHQTFAHPPHTASLDEKAAVPSFAPPEPTQPSVIEFPSHGQQPPPMETAPAFAHPPHTASLDEKAAAPSFAPPEPTQPSVIELSSHGQQPPAPMETAPASGQADLLSQLANLVAMAQTDPSLFSSISEVMNQLTQQLAQQNNAPAPAVGEAEQTFSFSP